MPSPRFEMVLAVKSLWYARPSLVEAGVDVFGLEVVAGLSGQEDQGEQDDGQRGHLDEPFDDRCVSIERWSFGRGCDQRRFSSVGQRCIPPNEAQLRRWQQG